MNAKLLVVLLIPLLASGCMMAGMAAAGGAGHMSGGAHRGGDVDMMREPSVIREVTSGAVRVVVEFPSFAPGKPLRYDATILDRDGRAVTDDAAIFLEVSPVIVDGTAASPAPARAGYPPKIAHASPDGRERTRLAPVERGEGRYVFRPTIPVEGAYRLAVVVERVGKMAVEPPIVVEHHAQVTSTAPMAPMRSPSTGGLTPLVLLGAGVMGVMMLLAIR